MSQCHSVLRYLLQKVIIGFEEPPQLLVNNIVLDLVVIFFYRFGRVFRPLYFLHNSIVSFDLLCSLLLRYLFNFGVVFASEFENLISNPLNHTLKSLETSESHDMKNKSNNTIYRFGRWCVPLEL